MTVVEQLSRFLAGRLGLRFEGDVFFGYMPERPVKAICVYAADLRRPGDAQGTRVQIAIRSDLDAAWPLEQAERIMAALDGQRGVTLTDGGSTALRIEAEQGFEYSGMENERAHYYAANFRIYLCGGGSGDC